MRILQEDVLLLVVDVQEKLFPHMADKERLLHKLQQLIKGMAILDVPILVSEQYVKGLGPTLASLRELLTGAEFFEKASFSCYDDEGIKQAIKDSGKKMLVVCGIESHVCVQQTVIDLQQDGYSAVLVADAVSSRELAEKECAIERVSSEGARLATVESILFELTRFSGTDTFKAIAKLIK